MEAMATGRQDSHRIALRPREYQRKQGGYEYRWREAVGKDENGKTLYKQHAVVAETLQELRKMEDDLKRTELAGIKPKQDMTLNECVDCWFKIKRGLRDNTRQNYIYMYNKFVRRSMLGSIKIQELKKSDLVSFYNRLTDKGALSISTCEVLQNVIGPSLQLAVEDDIIRRNVSANALKELKREMRQEKARLKAIGQYQRESLTLAEQKRLIEVVKDTPWEGVIMFALLTGLRVGELCGLTWSCIDEHLGVIHIKQTLVYYEQGNGKCTLSMHSTKTEAGTRDIPLSDDLKAILKKQKEYTKRFFDNDSERPSVDAVKDFIFFNRYGIPYRQDTLNRAIKRIVTNANNESDGNNIVLLPMFTMHKLRKTYATNMVRAGISLATLAKLLGHGTVDITAMIYVDAQQDIARDADEKSLDALREAGVLPKVLVSDIGDI
jgi:integrase